MPAQLPATSAPLGWISRWGPRILETHFEALRVFRSLIWPALDLVVRLILAQGFFVSGVLKVTNWSAAIYLAQNEYRVSWMGPVSAAYTGAAIELVCPILLAFGLLTRFAAVPMLVLSLVVQFKYNPVDTQLFSAALFGWYVISGAGPLSLDRLFRRRLADSARPLAASILCGSQWVRLRLAAPYLALVRLWSAVALLLAGLHVKSWFGVSILRLSVVMPVGSALDWPALLSVFCGGLLLTGLATRYAAIALIIVGVGMAMMHSVFMDDIYCAAMLAVLALHGGGRPSADAAIDIWARARFPQFDDKPASTGGAR